MQVPTLKLISGSLPAEMPSRNSEDIKGMYTPADRESEVVSALKPGLFLAILRSELSQDSVTVAHPASSCMNVCQVQGLPHQHSFLQ